MGVKVEYQGIFFNKENIEVLRNKMEETIENLGLKKLEKDVKDLHITFWYNPKEAFDTKLLGKDYDIKIIGYGQDENNSGFLADIPDELKESYKGAKAVHITMALSKEGNAIDTRDLNFEPIPEFNVKGKLSYVINNQVVTPNTQEQPEGIADYKENKFKTELEKNVNNEIPEVNIDNKKDSAISYHKE